MKPGKMTEEAKDFATLCFARFMRPMQVVRAVEERFGVTIERSLMQHYDPTSARGKSLGRKRKALFAEARERFLKELEEIPIANKAVRLQQLQLHYESALEGRTPNVRLALEVLEKAAKEVGGAHTNETRVHHTGKLTVREEVTEEDMRNGLSFAIAQILAEERDRLAGVTKH